MAVRLGMSAGLRNAATAEFLHDRDGGFWFLEVNTRLQVEHPVTELVAGVDIVHEQFRLAAGAPLSARAAGGRRRPPDQPRHGAAHRGGGSGARLRAGTGTDHAVGDAGGPGVRVDTAVEAGDRIPPEYDPLICKLIVHAEDRPATLGRLRRALDEVEVGGIQTTLPFHRAMLAEPGFVDATGLSTTWVDSHWDGLASRAEPSVSPCSPPASRSSRRRRGTVPLAELSQAGRQALASRTRSVTGSGGSRRSPAAASTWRTTGREIATDRWPT